MSHIGIEQEIPSLYSNVHWYDVAIVFSLVLLLAMKALDSIKT
tara:strand:- start:568 stop:696 length:129 start_codon:yes stop_codon:yes gene_type:complete